MKYSREQVFPEVNKLDYDRLVQPLLTFNRNHLNLKKINLQNKQILVSNISENYPYQKICNAVVDRIWNAHWLNEFNSDFVNYKSFRKTICKQLSQVVFSNFIRCFAEQIQELEDKKQSSQELYTLYNSNLIESNLKIFEEKYPVVWSRCHNILINRIESLGIMLSRLRNNREKIYNEFELHNSEKIYCIQSGGDSHNNGQTVNIIEFNSGKKIIYKPRSVSGEVGYHQFIIRFNKFFKTNLLSIRALDFTNFGFTEFIEKIEDETQCDMTDAGRLLCIMYMLNASDMHFENVLWTTLGPIPIDLETLFQPLRQKQINKVESIKSAYRKLARSVCGTGILPFSLDYQGNSDVGFTGFRDENTKSPVKTMHVSNGFTSNINIDWYSNDRYEKNDSLLDKPEYEVLVIDRCKDVINGFTELYLQISEQLETFKNMVLDCFKDMQIRYLHNMTYRYEQILRVLTATEPSKSIELARMLVSRLALLSSTSDISLPLSESVQIWNGDIPYLYVKFNSNIVRDINGSLATLSTTPQEDFLDKIKNLNREDLYNQIRLIRISFLSKIADSHEGKIFEWEKIENFRTGTDIVVVDAISKLIESIVDNALSDRFSHLPETWIGPISRRGSGWIPGVLGYDLYSGRIGIGLVLLIYGKHFRHKESYNLSKSIFEKISSILSTESFDKRNLLKIGNGAYSGLSGVIWSLYKAGEIEQNEDWMTVAESSWKFILEKDYFDDNFFDIISGSSGSLIVRYNMLPNYQLSSKLLNDIITKGYEEILNVDNSLTSGVAHGLGNLIWFFSIINRKHNDERVRVLVQKIHQIITTKFMNDEKEILVYKLQNQSNISNSWCNGLSGLLLAYYEAYKSGIIEKDFVIMIINQLKKTQIPVIPTLCHGGLGIIEILEYVRDGFSFEVDPLLNYLYNTLFCPDKVVEYLNTSSSRYALGYGLLTGSSGALLYLCKQMNKEIQFNPLVLR
ncbi:type 2 lanthipeptide synthetase LanM [Streptococcus mitis]|uniref:type 2 lanthipeptide synthetase LanM n=1 Tax=Streptococcus mitis TaxID=28037 RepID=UPI001C4E8C87